VSVGVATAAVSAVACRRRVLGAMLVWQDDEGNMLGRTVVGIMNEGLGVGWGVCPGVCSVSYIFFLAHLIFLQS
jgi:hypothetical protein